MNNIENNDEKQINSPIQQHEDQLDLQDCLFIALERIWLIITILIITIIIAGIWSFQQVPLYKATSQIQIQPRNQKIVQTQAEVGPMADGSDEYHNTMVKLLQNREIAKKTSNYLKKNYPKRFKQDEDYTDLVMHSTKIKPYAGTRLVAITAVSPDPEMAMIIANALAETFVYNQLDRKMSASTSSVRWLEAQAEEYKAKLFDAEEKLAAYREKTGQVSLEEQQNIIVLKLQDISHKLTEAEAERISAETSFQEMQNLIKEKKKPEEILQIITQPEVARLHQLLKEKELEISVLKERYKSGYPAMKQAERELSQIRKQYNNACEEAITKVKSKYEHALAQENNLRSELQKKTQDALRLNRQASEYNVLKRNAEQFESLYNNIIARMNETEIQGETESNNISIEDKAILPLRPFKPRHAQNLLIGAVVGAGLGFALALLLWITDNRIKKIVDIENEMGEKVIAAIPLIKRKFFNDNGTLKSDRHNNIIIEGFRTMHAELEDKLKNVKKIIILSSNPGEGKTFATTYFGAIGAERKHKVLLLNTDLRRPRLELMFGIEKKNGGLNAILTGKMQWKEAIVKTPIENLDVLPAGIRTANPTSMLESKKFNDLISELEKHYDLLIFDAPPILGLSDSRIMLSKMDAAIMIVNHNKSKKKATNYVIEKIKDSNTELLGVIINKITYGNHAYYYYYEQYGYNYYSSYGKEYKGYYSSSQDIVPNLDVKSMDKKSS